MNHDELQALIKRLRRGIEAKPLNEWDFDGAEEDMSAAADELEEILKLLEKQQKIIRRIYVEHFPDTYFVCGESGSKDQNGLPDRIEVCPAYGVDWSQIYERTDRQIGGMGS
jgi:hypothetical protein